MKLHVALKIARQIEGEYIFIRSIKGYLDRARLAEFLDTYKYTPVEKIENIDCVVEIGVIEVEIADEFLVQSAGTQIPADQFYNRNNLPIASIITGAFPTLSNPDILSWKDFGDGTKEGSGLVWIDPNEPLVVIDQQTFASMKYFGEIRLTQKYVKGRYGPLAVAEAQNGDLYNKEQLS